MIRINRQLVLTYDAADVDDPAYCARLIGETWRRIPLAARRRMLRYWRTDSMGEIARNATDYDGPLPLIELAELDDASGECRINGHILRFDLPAMRTVPADIMRDVIAHEFAHAYHNTLDPGPAPFDGAGWEQYNEDIVAEILDRWGFDDSSLDEYARRFAAQPADETALVSRNLDISPAAESRHAPGGETAN